MKRLFLLLLFILPTSLLAVPAVYRGCYDGDTCRFDIPGIGKYQSVRLLGVDTPEKKARCLKEQFLANQAAAFTNQLLKTANKITLAPKGRDKYGRLLAWVDFDGLDLSTLLIEQGLGRSYSGGRRASWCKASEVQP